MPRLPPSPLTSVMPALPVGGEVERCSVLETRRARLSSPATVSRASSGRCPLAAQSHCSLPFTGGGHDRGRGESAHPIRRQESGPYPIGRQAPTPREHLISRAVRPRPRAACPTLPTPKAPGGAPAPPKANHSCLAFVPASSHSHCRACSRPWGLSP